MTGVAPNRSDCANDAAPASRLSSAPSAVSTLRTGKPGPVLVDQEVRRAVHLGEVELVAQRVEQPGGRRNRGVVGRHGTVDERHDHVPHRQRREQSSTASGGAGGDGVERLQYLACARPETGRECVADVECLPLGDGPADPRPIRQGRCRQHVLLPEPQHPVVARLRLVGQLTQQAHERGLGRVVPAGPDCEQGRHHTDGNRPDGDDRERLPPAEAATRARRARTRRARSRRRPPRRSRRARARCRARASG